MDFTKLMGLNQAYSDIDKYLSLEGSVADVEYPEILSFDDIKQAADRIEGAVIHTPLCEAKLSKFTDYNIYLKCENLQFTGSYAERGMRNALEVLDEDRKSRGVILASTGDMALGAAYHGRTLGIPVTAVLPEGCAPATAQRCSELGAAVVLCGASLDDAAAYASKAARETGQTVLSSDDISSLAGLGGAGAEVVRQLPGADCVLAPVRSGALLAAVLVACKKMKCTCLVYGAECSSCPRMMRALQAGRPERAPPPPGELGASSVGANAFATIKNRLDRMLVVEESWVARATVALLERERLVAGGAGAVALAAVMQGLVPELKGKRTVCIISSDSVDAGRLARVIQRGLGAGGRLLRFAVPLPDHRAGLEGLTKAVFDESAVLKSIVTEQMWVHGDVCTTWANVVVETASEEHSAIFKEKLRELYPSARFAVMLQK
ncbi:unnamed protein product [Plutella xylostella]|uniref:L-serine deaminase n=1 Tax=Plutella xylostella TaxID=51655 RepID=A0A8S4FXI2_PLUXY|nr:unnamed protein product [Plutella xylostella]